MWIAMINGVPVGERCDDAETAWSMLAHIHGRKWHGHMGIGRHEAVTAVLDHLATGEWAGLADSEGCGVIAGCLPGAGIVLIRAVFQVTLIDIDDDDWEDD